MPLFSFSREQPANKKFDWPLPVVQYKVQFTWKAFWMPIWYPFSIWHLGSFRSKLLTMQDPMTVAKPGQLIRVHKGVYKGDLGFVTHVEAWGARVLVVPHLKTLALEVASTLLKRKWTAIRPEPKLFAFSSVFQRQPNLLHNGTYTSRGLVFNHGLLRLDLDLHSISSNSTGVPSH